MHGGTQIKTRGWNGKLRVVTDPAEVERVRQRVKVGTFEAALEHSLDLEEAKVEYLLRLQADAFGPRTSGHWKGLGE